MILLARVGEVAVISGGLPNDERATRLITHNLSLKTCLFLLLVLVC